MSAPMDREHCTDVPCAFSACDAPAGERCWQTMDGLNLGQRRAWPHAIRKTQWRRWAANHNPIAR